MEPITSGASSWDQDLSEARNPAPAILIPKSASLSQQICVAVKCEGDVDFLGTTTFHLWELTHTFARKLKLLPRQYLLPEEVESDETGHYRAP